MNKSTYDILVSSFISFPNCSVFVPRLGFAGSEPHQARLRQWARHLYELSGPNAWFAFATNSGGINVEIALSTDFVSWLVTGEDALPTVGAWVDASNPAVWAPMVVQIADGSFVLYYAATNGANTTSHCVGVATSSTISGPYTPQDDAFICHPELGGAVDPAGYQDPDGSLYVVYKVDGNNIGNGGSCNNGVAPIQPTPIMLQQVAADGFTKIGDEVEILDRDDGDGPLIEAPSLINVNGVYCSVLQLWLLFRNDL
ncbi:hypothetical protein H0H92_002900 [Tricholoma furcatifolium]|nr:hypothetical protein H0H92_002900 [Tricholoma furcatifolium]